MDICPLIGYTELRKGISPLVSVCSESAASLPRKEYALWEEKLQKKLLGSEKSIGNLISFTAMNIRRKRCRLIIPI